MNSKPVIIILILLFTSMFLACEKVKCDDAQLCIKNIGSDTIYFCWGCNIYNDSILPGGVACRNVGPIEINSTTENVVWVDFESSKGNYRIKVDDCIVEKEIQ